MKVAALPVLFLAACASEPPPPKPTYQPPPAPRTYTYQSPPGTVARAQEVYDVQVNNCRQLATLAGMTGDTSLQQVGQADLAVCLEQAKTNLDLNLRQVQK